MLFHVTGNQETTAEARRGEAEEMYALRSEAAVESL